MTAPSDAAVIPADPVLDGELIDDQPPGQHQWLQRMRSWWQRSPRVPAALKSRAHAAQAGKDITVTVICAPWWFVGATARGTVLAVRAWRRWVSVHDYREAAEQSEKLADKYVEIRELTLFRWRVTGAVTGVGTAGIAVAEMLYGPPALWTTTVIAAVVLVITGRRRDGSPGRRAVLAGPRSLTWTWTRRSWSTHSATPNSSVKTKPCAWWSARVGSGQDGRSPSTYRPPAKRRTWSKTAKP
jgi:S-DNA-T family DNA segregation ATPase FtsK/SpoIIIE